MIDVATTNLTKKFKDKVAVDNISLEIEQGELFGLLGTNGAGKTTIIKMLSTLLSPTSGEIKLAGFDIQNDKQKIKQIINISPQETAIALNLTVKENLMFMAGMYNIKDKKQRVEELIKMFNLEEVLNQRAKTLSGGWQRKLSLALALINQPKILFLDEPTLGLDVLARRELWKIIQNLKGKITIILTSHYMEEIEFLADRVAILSKGKMIFVGSKEKLLEFTQSKNLEDAYVKVVTDSEVIDDDN